MISHQVHVLGTGGNSLHFAKTLFPCNDEIHQGNGMNAGAEIKEHVVGSV